MNVTLVSETNTTITVGWTVPAWQEGYVPIIDGSEILTDGKRHPSVSMTASSVKIGKPAGETNPATKHKYGVRLLGVSDVGEYNPTPVPSPASYGFDEMTPIQTSSPAPFTSVQAKPWAAGTGSGSSYWGTISRDASFGFKTLRFDLPGNAPAPYTLERAQAYITRQLDEGVDDVHTYEFRFPAGLAAPGPDLITETNFQNVLSKGPSRCLKWRYGPGGGVSAPWVEFVLSAGKVQATPPVYEFNSSKGSAGTNIPKELAAIPAARYQPDVWHQLVVALHNARDLTGTIRVWHRVKGGTWAQTVDVSNIKTLQTDSAGNFPSQTTLDVVNAYRHTAPSPSHHFLLSWWRWKTVVDGMAYLNAR